jgi:hypothetical protein
MFPTYSYSSLTYTLIQLKIFISYISLFYVFRVFHILLKYIIQNGEYFINIYNLERGNIKITTIRKPKLTSLMLQFIMLIKPFDIDPRNNEVCSLISTAWFLCFLVFSVQRLSLTSK